jgi:hypothetical protein
MHVDELPYVDEHATLVAAGLDDVWTALVETVDGGFPHWGAAGYARLVGCADTTASGPRPLAEGSAIPGFHVVAAVPGSELVLAGSHRFSSYALSFHLEALGSDLSRLRATTRAEFPGLAGGAYRLLVIGTRGHVVAVRRMLAGIRHRSEQRATVRS